MTGLSGIYLDYNNANGNINAKTDAGSYSYLLTKPNAVSAVTNPNSVIAALQQLISYTPFLQPQTISENNYELTYTYGADYERIKGILKQNGALQRTRYYLGPGYEKDIVNGGANREIHYIDPSRPDRHGGAGEWQRHLPLRLRRPSGLDSDHYQQQWSCRVRSDHRSDKTSMPGTTP